MHPKHRRPQRCAGRYVNKRVRSASLPSGTPACRRLNALCDSRADPISRVLAAAGR